jgi:hypothetical protein
MHTDTGELTKVKMPMGAVNAFMLVTNAIAGLRVVDLM